MFGNTLDSALFLLAQVVGAPARLSISLLVLHKAPCHALNKSTFLKKNRAMLNSGLRVKMDG